MVDDAEFMKRRHLSRGRPRKYEPSSSSGGGNQPPGNEGGSSNNSSDRQSTPLGPTPGGPHGPGGIPTSMTANGPLGPNPPPGVVVSSAAAAAVAAAAAAAQQQFKSGLGGPK